ncbi:uncharacterized protein METZ01_LOCUS117123 [marine metagenome]|uniref:FlgD/Vpr Ig-like domain-containing protein n=1 Tax=marine metagenome TaxID=408172 RepID=A0A381XHS5_9ZZZZ
MKKVANYLIISRLLIFISFSSLIIGQTVFNPIVIDNTVVGSKSVFAADMDGDGDMDIVSSSDDWNTGKIKWHENDGSADPTLTSENIQAFSGIGIVAVFAADMDGDGDMDIVSASEIPGTIGWSENDGAVDPTWSSRSSIANVSNVESVFAADMDADGDMDILTTSWYNSKLDWYENDGATDPTWSKANIGSGGGPKSVFAADMDGDGDMDIAAAFAENNSIAWYENDGATDPTWTVAVIATNAEWASSVYVADMDGDGDMDIVSGSEDDDTIAWYENDGATDPTFAAVDVFKSDDYVSPISVSAADMDGDGDMDIVTISSFTLSWFANDGATDPTWTGTDILDEYGFRSIFLADMDKDGDTDIVSSTSSKISWFEAILPPDEISFLSLTDVTIKEDEIYSVTFISKSDDGNSIAFSAESDNNSVTASISSSTLTVTPTANWYGVANIKVSASVGSTTEEVSFKLTVTAVSDISTVQDVTIDEDKVAEVDLISTFSGTTTFTAVSDTNAVTASISSSSLTLTPNANWHGVANIKAYASDGTSKDSTSFKLTVTAVNDAPTAFEWVSSASDTINITPQSNLDDTYNLQWSASTDVESTIDYLLHVQIGVYPAEEIYDTTSTSVQITYQEFLENVFELFPMLPGATVKFSVVATDGIDTVKVTGDDRVVYVNRYAYLSIAVEGIPLEFALHENYPNPFNPTTTLRFDLPEVSDITLTIYNMLGQKVRTFDYQNTSAGYHSVTWDATNNLGQQVGAGVYLYQLQTKNFVKTRKMVLLK